MTWKLDKWKKNARNPRWIDAKRRLRESWGKLSDIVVEWSHDAQNIVTEWFRTFAYTIAHVTVFSVLGMCIAFLVYLFFKVFG